MAEYEFSAELNSNQVLAELKKISGLMEDVNKRGQDAFEGIGQKSEESGAKIGFISGVVSGVTEKILELGQAAVGVLKDLVVDSVNISKSFETVKASLTGIFDGSEEQATAAFDFIRKESQRLGVDLSEIAPAFLPKVESLDQFSKVAEQIAALAALDPAQGAEGARLALSEALAGDTNSLKLRFEIDPTAIKAAQAELGDVEGLIVGLDQVLKERGQSFENFAGTANVSLAQIGQVFVDLQATFGQPILEVFNSALTNLQSLLSDNEVEIQVIVDALGRLAAAGAEIVSAGIFNFAQNIDTGAIINFIEQLDRTLEYFKAAKEIIPEISLLFGLFSDATEEAAGANSTWLDELIDGRSKLEIFNDGIKATLQLVALLGASLQGVGAGLSEFFGSIDDVLSGQKSLSQAFEDADAVLAQVKRDAAIAAGEKINNAFDQADQNAADFAAATDQKRTDLNKPNDVTDVNNTLANGQADRDAAAAAEEAAAAKEELAKAQEKVNDANEKFDTDKARKAAEEQIKTERELIDLQIKFSQQREDLARKNADKIADIYAKNRQRIADAAKDLERDQQDIVKSGARKQEDLDRDIANDRIKIEEDYQRELQSIKERFTASAQDAIRANDAIAFLSAQRQRDQELQNAERGRQTEIQDSTQSAQQKREELAVELAREVEDAKIANQRKLEDAQAALQQELEQQRQAFAQQLNEQAIKEQRETEQLQTAQNRRKMDFDRYWQQRLEDLQKNLKKELDLIAKAEEQKQSLSKKRPPLPKNEDGTTNATNDTAGTTQTENDGTVRTGAGVRASQRRHSGGPVTAGETYRLQQGEFLAKAPFTGQVLPVNRLMNGQVGGSNTTVNNSPVANFPIEMKRGLKPADMQRIQAFVYQVMMESFEG